MELSDALADTEPKHFSAEQDGSDPLNWRSLVRPRVQPYLAAAALSSVYAALVLLRRPDLLVHPQYYAEDGQAWFANAYNMPPLHALLQPLGGYYAIFQPVSALLLTPLGLVHTATAFAVLAVVVQIVPPLFFASPRLRSVIASDRARAMIAALYLIVPNEELTGNLTNSQWHLALLAFLVLIAAAPRSRSWRAFDVGALLVAGLSGPFILVLLPLAVAIHRKGPVSRYGPELATLAGCAAVQVGVIVATVHAGRHPMPLGASADLLPLIVVNQTLERLGNFYLASRDVPLAVADAVVIALILVGGLRRGPRSLRYFIVFAVALAASGLLVPYARTAHELPWVAMAEGAYARYFFFFFIAFALSFLALVRGIFVGRRADLGALVIAGLVVAGGAATWQYPGPALQHLDHYQALLNHSPKGTIVTIPINPPGWTMKLIAH